MCVDTLWRVAAQQSLGVYVSFPFCRQKCTYCNFASGVFSSALRTSYLRALEGEIQAAGPLKVETLYFGGGTPSLLEEDELARLTAPVIGESLREFTMEAAPGDVTPEKARAWAGLGVNRVSLGVQSFDETVARNSGRRHNAEVVAREIETLRTAGIDRINVDLISGLARQTQDTWSREFEYIERLGVRHVSVYMLEADDESRLGEELRKGGSRYGAAAVPTEDQIADFYLQAVDQLARLGIERYEISNFSALGHESQHNLKYWTLQPYIGFGADAHSFDGRARWANVRDVGDYVGRWESDGTTRESHDVLGADRLAEDLLMTGLRTREGAALPEDAEARFAGPMARLIERGWLERAPGNRIRLTPEGVMYSNEALQQLLFENEHEPAH